MRDDGDEDEQTGRGRKLEREPDAEAVDEAVRAEPGGAQRADALVRPCVLLVVPVVQHERALGEEERQEPGADEPRHVARVADRVDRLGEHVEERDSDDDAAGERDQSCQFAADAQRHVPACERRTSRQRSERNRPVRAHARNLQSAPSAPVRGGRGRRVAKSCLQCAFASPW